MNDLQVFSPIVVWVLSFLFLSMVLRYEMF